MSGLTDLRGCTALVTGASRGLGKAIAARLGGAGCRVALTYREKAEAAEAAVRAIVEAGGDARAFAADVSRADDVRRLVEAVESAFGPVGILVNNAGITRPQALEDVTEADWDELLTVNLKSAFLLTQAVLPGMRSLPWGRIVTIGSIASQTGGLVGPHYAAAKAGLVGLTHSYAVRLAAFGITANAIAPALIQTDMVPDTPELRARIPVGRLGHVDEVAEAVMLLASNGYMTGQTLCVNGGLYFTS